MMIKSLINTVLIAAAVVMTAGAVRGQSEEIIVGEYLNLGPVEAPAEIFSQGEDLKGWVEKDAMDWTEYFPAEGDTLVFRTGVNGVWRKVTGEDWKLFEGAAEPQVDYTVFYISTGRRQKVTIKVETPYAGKLMVDGKSEAKCVTAGTAEAPNLLLAECDWHSGKHIVVVKAVKANGTRGDNWSTRVKVSPEEGIPVSSLSITTGKMRQFTQFDYYYELEEANGLTISPEGKFIAFERKIRKRSDLSSKQTIEVRQAKDGKLVREIEFGGSVSTPRFSEDGEHIYFRNSQDGGTVLWKQNLVTGETEKSLGPIKGLVKLILSPDEKFAYYTIDGERKTKGTDKYKMMTDLEERLTDWHDARCIYSAVLGGGTQTQVSAAGDFAVDEIALAPEGDVLYFTRRIAIEGRPFFQTEFWALNLLSGENRLLASMKAPFETRPLNLTILPGGKYLLCTMASRMSDDVEVNGRMMNLSETDIWRLNLQTSEFVNITGDRAAPSGEKGYTVDEYIGTVNSLMWNDKEKQLYFGAMVRGFNKLFSIEVENPHEIKEVDLGEVYVKDTDLAGDGRSLVYSGQGLNEFKRVMVYDLKSKKKQMIFDSGSRSKEKFEWGKFERWDFTDSLGETIDGWILYPPDFDSTKTYPCIVYYYAGVWMLDESFYYSYLFWAANGYVVYALSPVGCMAHGDNFSAYHTNDWGTYATQDIIEGTEKLIKEKPFIDAKRLGCYGGSYGGFTTMDLITKTDMFACAVSMYGISNIASYWGGGIWGYTYGDIALAKSYPWNRKDLFTENSPLFNADKITTPLLLLHGEADVNVPVLESEQMFTALNVLGKDVAMVKFPGEDHGIAGSAQVYVAHREMMLEWFDKYLKGQGQGWERRWKNGD